MRYEIIMRTTLDLEEDVVKAAKSIAKIEGKSLGAVISQLSRKGLSGDDTVQTRNGIRLFPRRDSEVKVTMELVNELRDAG